MIGFDLDGVLCCDMFIEQYENILQFLMARQSQKAIFVPDKEYVIITGRPLTDVFFTKEWVSRELKTNLPSQLYHSNEDIKNSAEYKASVINSIGLDMFVESDIEQVEIIKKLSPKCVVIYFKDYIKNAIHGLY